MDSQRYYVRPFLESDYEAYADLRNQYHPARPLSTQQLRFLSEAYLAADGVRRWFFAIERASDRPVAHAALEQRSYNFHPRKFWASVTVAPDHLGRGIGRALAARLEEEARKHDAIALWGEVRTDLARGVDFFHRQGFHEVRRHRLSRLGLEATNVDRLPDRTSLLRSQGIAITTLAEEGPERDEVRAKYFDLVRIADRDVPELGERTSLTFEQFVRAELGSPEFFPEGTFLAKTASEYVGVSSLEREGTNIESVRIGFTGTAPGYRRRGIATELKRHGIALARHLGYRWMDTGNDSGNRAIGSINERLGFRLLETRILGEKPLRPGD